MATKVLKLTGRDWWKEERLPSADLVIKKQKKGIPEKFLTVQEVAKRLNVGVWCIYDFIHSGQLSHYPIGRRKRIALDDLEEFLMQQKIKFRAI